jgi:transposase-like protein
MNCPHCHAANCVKNGTSRHGHQRWRCPECKKTFGEKDRRCVAPETKAAALAQYLEGVGQRATERLLGVSHNSITNWVKQAVFGKVLQPTPAEKVEWVEADELWTYIAKKKMIAGSGGLLIVLPNRSWGGRWGIVEPKRPSGWLRNCLTPLTSSLPPTSGIPTGKSSAIKTTSKARRTPLPSKA